MNRDEHKLFGEHLDKIGAALRDARAAHAVIRPDCVDPKSDRLKFFSAGKTLADCGFYDKAAALNDDDDGDGDAGGTKTMSLGSNPIKREAETFMEAPAKNRCRAVSSATDALGGDGTKTLSRSGTKAEQNTAAAHAFMER
jgi:hypothetical protein